MASIGQKLENKGVIAMTLLTLVLIGTGCEDRIDNPAVNPSEGETVEVSLNIGVADEEDGYDLSASTKAVSAEKNSAIDMELVPTIATRTTTAKPDKLYRLEIRQYKQDGSYLNGNDPITEQTIGQKLTVDLTLATDCQLVFVAWGKGSDQWGEGIANSLGKNKSLSEAQEISIDADKINSITDDDMNAMPYVLHLKHVNVTNDGIISSPDGKDVRLLLKRLATRLNLSWDYKVTDYALKQIILQSIPSNYKVVAAPDQYNKYPSEMDQYTNIQLTEQEINNHSYSRWIPANVRGFNTASNSPLYRIKVNAPTGSAYASFIAVNDNDIRKKFNYRVYLGGKDYSDFNLYENTDYNYTVKIQHNGIPTNDRRVTYIDPIPASDNNENFVNTANCFMVAPGGYFNFNPYKYYVDGKVTDNTLLQGWCNNSSKIQSVKVLWQTLENGDIGDPVLGTVNSSDDHTNIVDIKVGTNFDDARIYCRVAPNTTGGSGVIAAYSGKDGTGDILWSWHIWVTDYNPDPTGNQDVQKPENKRKLKFRRKNFSDQNPMMDRNLGAMAGYVSVPESELERSKTNGFHYQWGRKDPFRSSYSSKKITKIEAAAIDKPIEGILSLYKADGITFFPMLTIAESADYQKACRNPQNVYKPKTSQSDNQHLATWIDNINSNEYKYSWGMSGNKGPHDPCPAGWRVCSYTNYHPLFTSGLYNPGSVNLKNSSTLSTDGGALLRYDDTNSDLSTYFRFVGFWRFTGTFDGIGINSLLWCREKLVNSTSGTGGYHLRFDLDGKNLAARLFADGGWEQEALLTRCIQEQK